MATHTDIDTKIGVRINLLKKIKAKTKYGLIVESLPPDTLGTELMGRGLSVSYLGCTTVKRVQACLWQVSWLHSRAQISHATSKRTASSFALDLSLQPHATREQHIPACFALSKPSFPFPQSFSPASLQS